MKLGVNIDHIATLRNARRINEPDPLMALEILKEAGADQVTIHLREDRRHITDFDAQRIVQNSFLPVNMECSINPEIIDIICTLKPHRATLVPERREEVTTEGGLDVVKFEKEIKNAIEKLHKNDIEVSLFIDPDTKQIEKSAELKAEMIELHTGRYANLFLALNTNINETPFKIFENLDRKTLKKELELELKLLKDATLYANDLNLEVAAGHGLNYQNVKEIANIKEIVELNIGHSIIANSVFLGLKEAIIKMKKLISS
ncbi:pyridoxine 5'-phosphate synthase [Caminibacter pacificus]|uniref:Pyridoxine 5'-phosphate synthase n=1 Tax=Caminibacter pacificus TaxID=1424653 RepID=A0AAE6B789_9BACT|nr:pyridoxine 5'-phosphate synthase [Caminibacter pacificus]QCI28226.1 pyridoxine 5'-phosphate synthase [Caminibacter pacificus]ROR41060.1 pyridoxine 5'-phosphate synthase [Caminibacter pacificus]